MTKFCRRCTQQCQHEKSQFCTVPGSPANLTKQGLLAVRSTKVPREPILVTEKWRRKIFLRASRNDRRYASLCTAFGSLLAVPGQLQYPGYAIGVKEKAVWRLGPFHLCMDPQWNQQPPSNVLVWQMFPGLLTLITFAPRQNAFWDWCRDIFYKHSDMKT